MPLPIQLSPIFFYFYFFCRLDFSTSENLLIYLFDKDIKKNAFHTRQHVPVFVNKILYHGCRRSVQLKEHCQKLMVST